MINLEFGMPSNAPFSFGCTAERALTEKPTGSISFSDFYGKLGSSCEMIFCNG